MTTETYMKPPQTITYISGATTDDLMNLIEYSGTLDFWLDSEEDVYDENDGDAV
jgi:hypothetical protein